MKPDIYKEYLRVIKEGIENGTVDLFKEDHLDELDQEKIIVTIKNYNVPNGLSKMVHEATLN